jgi:hypothetical protein
MERKARGRLVIIGKKAALLIFASVCIFITGCTTPLFLGLGQVANWASSGIYYYMNGELKTDYHFSLDQVWSAVEKTITDMKGRNVVADRKIGRGQVTAIINNDKVQFDMTYRKKDVTTLIIRVGALGDEARSRMLQDRIAEHLFPKSAKSY